MYLTEEMEIITEKEAEGRNLKLGKPILVGHDRRTGAITAHQVPTKGIGDGWPARRIIIDLEEAGYAGTPIILKCDQEGPIVAVQRRVMQDRRAPTTPQNSPVGESQSNGAVENAIKRVQGQLRTLKLATEKRIRKRITSEHPAFAWLLEWAATILNRYVKGTSGHTPYKMITGKETKRPIAEFGERVLYMPLKSSAAVEGKMEERYHQGIWLGLRQKSDEALIGTENGVIKVRSVRRVVEEKRWEAKLFMGLKGTPQQPIPGRIDDHVPTATGKMGSKEDEHDHQVPMPDLPEADPHIDLRAAPAPDRSAPRMYVKQTDIDKYGKTVACPGCETSGTTRFGRHTDECRDRIRNLMQGDEDGRARLEREKSRADRIFEKEVNKSVQLDPNISRAEREHEDALQQAESRMDEDIPPVGEHVLRPEVGPQPAQEPASSSTGRKRPADEPAENLDTRFDSLTGAEVQPASPDTTVSFESDLREDIAMGEVGAVAKGGRRGSCTDASEGPKSSVHILPGFLRSASGVDVSEVYSPPRVATAATRRGLTAGTSFDITTGWDLLDPEVQRRCRAKIIEEKPNLLIASVMCRDWSQIMNINWERMGSDEKTRRMNEARIHLDFVCSLLRLQHDQGRYFVHEHPQGAGSWQEAVIIETQRHTGADILTIDQCCYGLTSVNTEGEVLPAMKPTKIMTNCPGMRTTLYKRCSDLEVKHRHTRLEGGKRTKAAQVYPAELVKMIIDGYIVQKQWDSRGLNVVHSISDDASREGSDHPAEETMESKRGAAQNDTFFLEKLPEFKAKTIMALHSAVMSTIESIYAIENGIMGELPPEEEEQDAWLMEAWDDVNGKRLDPTKVRKARKEEIGYYYKMKMYDKVPISECITRTGRQPIGVRWIDHNKGDDLHENYRCRLVAQQFNSGPMDENIFAATPPLEALRMVISNATTGSKTKVIMIADVSRAYMYARIPDDEYCYVKLCEEDQETEEEKNMCGRLRGAMYGTRKASQYWQNEYTNTMVEAGFQTGRASPCTFKHEEKDLMTFVHGDDFVASGELKNIVWMREKLEKKYKSKVTIIGEAPELAKEGRILNRIIRWHPGRGVSYEADPRHAEEIIKSTGADKMTGVSSPMVKENFNELDVDKYADIAKRKAAGQLGKKKKPKADEDWQGSYVYGSVQSDPDVGELDDQPAEVGEAMSSERATEYRSITARANFLSSDRADIIYAVKECARCMATPTVKDWEKLVRLGRYLKTRPRVVVWYEYQDTPDHTVVFSDTDWAGCRKTRRSTTGGVAMYGLHMIKMWSRTQALVALSSAEAELYGIVKATAELKGLISLWKDLGLVVKGHLLADANAALGILRRRGLGKVRHLNTNYLWVQEVMAKGEIDYGKVAGADNNSDLFTKALDGPTIDKHTNAIGCEFTAGKDDLAYTIHFVGSAPQKGLFDDKLGEILQLKGAYSAWIRTDIGATTTKTSMRGGPDWSQVRARITVDADTNKFIKIERAKHITRNQEHSLLYGGERNIMTILIFNKNETQENTYIKEANGRCHG